MPEVLAGKQLHKSFGLTQALRDMSIASARARSSP
jgi:hypothetical protein